MTLERTLELRDECRADLEEAIRQGHAGWRKTLFYRLQVLQKLVEERRLRPVHQTPSPFVTRAITPDLN